ncbi:MAG: DUF1330 domain-containing protein [Betaproteobacteria bacterium]|nr:DUF1330 domain-containing protein [Betaproteobacteria bacterium]
MAAYVIAEVEVTDPQVFEQYRREVPATLAAFNGRFVVRGGACETLEGDWQPKRLVVLEFPDRTAAKAWWSSQTYAAPKALRQRSATTQLLIVDGV